MLTLRFSFDFAAAARMDASVAAGVASYWKLGSSCIFERNCCVCESVNLSRVTSLSTAVNKLAFVVDLGTLELWMYLQLARQGFNEVAML